MGLRNLFLKCRSRPWLHRWKSRLFGLLEASSDFVPSDISDLRCWLRADLGVSTVGSDVSNWADQSGNGIDFEQATASARPLLVEDELNGEPVIRGDGTADFLYNTARAIVGGDAIKTLFVVFNPGSTVTSEVFLCEGTFNAVEGGGSGRVQMFYSISTAYQTSGFGGTIVWDEGSVADEFHVLIFTQPTSDATDYELRIDNGPLVTKSIDPSYTYTVNPNSGLFCIIDFDSTPHSTFCDGDIAELIVYSRELTEDERTEVYDYLVARYAL